MFSTPSVVENRHGQGTEPAVDVLRQNRQTGAMKMIRISTALALAALPLAGCATLFDEGTASVHTLELGQTGDFGPVDLTPIGVDEDSRCPAGTQCIWAGQVRVKVLVEPAGADHAVIATLGQPLAIDGGTLLIEGVMPARGSTAPIPPSHYSFAIRYTADAR
jgi:hypothetical protein